MADKIDVHGCVAHGSLCAPSDYFRGTRNRAPRAKERLLPETAALP